MKVLLKWFRLDGDVFRKRRMFLNFEKCLNQRYIKNFRVRLTFLLSSFYVKPVLIFLGVLCLLLVQSYMSFLVLINSIYQFHDQYSTLFIFQQLLSP